MILLHFILTVFTYHPDKGHQEFEYLVLSPSIIECRAQGPLKTPLGYVFLTANCR